MLGADVDDEVVEASVPQPHQVRSDVAPDELEKLGGDLQAGLHLFEQEANIDGTYIQKEMRAFKTDP